MNTRTMTLARVSRTSLVLAAAAALALSTAYLVRPVFATQPDPLHKVTICHRTNSVTHPYVIETVDEASVDGDKGNDNGKGDHLLEHLGPVFDTNNPPPPPHNGDQWGDIIPPFYSDGSTPTGYPSLNWDADGRATFDNGCKLAGEEESVAESESEAESVNESESEAESVTESESEAESAHESGEQSVEAGTGTPQESVSNSALSLSDVGSLPTILFSLILLASLGTLAYANVKSVRNIR